MFALRLVPPAVALALMGSLAVQAADEQAVLATYADIAHAGYEDSLLAARALRQAVGALVAAASVLFIPGRTPEPVPSPA